jgi:hypothetical protein
MLAVMDFEFHSPASQEALRALNPSAVYDRLRADMRGLRDPKDSMGEGLPYPNVAGFVSGYNAAMFSYLL